MTFGEPGKGGARVHDIKDVEAILDAFRAHGHTEVGFRSSLWTLVPQLIYDSCYLDRYRSYIRWRHQRRILGKNRLVVERIQDRNKALPEKGLVATYLFLFMP
jgi:hypothetical protein